MRYFVTGATGFLGGHLVRHLVDRGDEVVALVRSPGTESMLPADVDVARGNVTDKESMREPMRDVDGVFHVAARAHVGVGDPTTTERVNVDGTRNVLELVDELGVPRAVYTSSLGVVSDTRGQVVDESYRYEGPHLSVYDRTKWEAHYEVAEPMMERGVPIVVVLPAAVYGPPVARDGEVNAMRRIWRRYLRGDLPFVIDGGATCWEHVEDSALAHLLAMEEGIPGETYVITGEPRSYVEIFELAEDLTGIPAPRSISPRWISALVPLVRQVERVVTPPGPWQSEVLRRLAGVTWLADNAKARRELGLTHRPLREGLGEYLEWERAELDRERATRASRQT